MPDCLTAARSLAALGYKVFPAIANDKKPLTPHGLLDATTDANQIERWWSSSNANLAIATEGLLVVDIDTIGGQPNTWLIDDPEKLADLGAAPSSITPRGGRHHWFRQPAGSQLRNTVGKLAPGIDTRASGGYAVVPPSAVDGVAYRWADGLGLAIPPEQLPEPPAWLIAMLESIGKPSAPTSKSTATGKIPDGERNSTLASLAGTMRRRNMSQGAILAALQAENASKCDPPLDAGEVEAIAKGIVRYEPKQNSKKPTVDVTCHDLAVPTRAVWGYIGTLNDPPAIFSFGGLPSRIERNDKSEPVIKLVGLPEMRWQLAEWLRFVRRSERNGETDCPPPMDIVGNVLATPDKPLPCLMQIVEAPVFGADGSLSVVPGYHAGSQTLYMPRAGLVIPSIPPNPSPKEIKAAAALLREMICDFPFVNESERAHALCLPLQFFARNLIDGPTPLYMFEKPSPGTGGTLLVEVLTYLPVGRIIAGMTATDDEDEMRKRITSQLRTSPAFILIDNLRARLDAACLASAITATAWEDRILGSSTIGRFPVRCAWIATANNPTMSLELARRTVRVRIDAKTDQPWLRSGFKHADLRGWVADNRGRLVGASLTLIQAWLAAGRPDGKESLGMFESWAKVMGGILDVAGVPGFLANRADFYAEADTEGQAMRSFIADWWGQHKGASVQTAFLHDLATTHLGEHIGGGGEQSQRIRLGKLLSGARDRVFDAEGISLRVTTPGKKARGTLWALALAA